MDLGDYWVDPRQGTWGTWLDSLPKIPPREPRDMELTCRFTQKSWFCSCGWMCDCDSCPGDEEWKDCVCLLEDDDEVL